MLRRNPVDSRPSRRDVAWTTARFKRNAHTSGILCRFRVATFLRGAFDLLPLIYFILAGVQRACSGKGRGLQVWLPEKDYTLHSISGVIMDVVVPDLLFMLNLVHSDGNDCYDRISDLLLDRAWVHFGASEKMLPTAGNGRM